MFIINGEKKNPLKYVLVHVYWICYLFIYLFIYFNSDNFWTTVLQIFMCFQTAYQSKDVVHKFIRKIHALPFLPAEHIGPAFRHLCGQTTSTPLLDLLKYVRNTWLQSTIWTVDSWSVFMQPIRTNNDVEGWHRRLNVKANDSKVGVSLCIINFLVKYIKLNNKYIIKINY